MDSSKPAAPPGGVPPPAVDENGMPELPPSTSLEETLKWATKFVQDNSKEEPGKSGESLDDSHL